MQTRGAVWLASSPMVDRPERELFGRFLRVMGECTTFSKILDRNSHKAMS